MKREKNASGTPCSVIFTIAIIATGIYLVYKLVGSITITGIIKTIKDFLLAVGFCIGITVLFIAISAVYSFVESRLPPIRLRRRGKAYPVRGYAIELEATSPDSIPAYQPESGEPKTILPVYLLVSITNYGLSLAELSAKYAWNFIPKDNGSRFNQVSENHPGPIIYPIGAIYLFYILFRKQGDLSVEQRPENMHGFTGRLQIPSEIDQVKIVIIDKTMMEVEKLPQIISREKPIKLELVVLDKEGKDDPDATKDLYNALYKIVHAQIESDDESWMYRSRPNISWWY
jgi:hypothetical protein